MNKPELLDGTMLAGGIPDLRARAERPLVGILVPSHDFWMAGMGLSMSALMAFAGSHARPFMINQLGASIAFSRQVLVEAALQQKAQYILFVDSDIAFPHDALKRLLSHGKNIVGATYARKRPPYFPLGWPAEENFDWMAKGVHRFDNLPAGMMLVRASIFERLERPWFFETWDFTKDPPFDSEDTNFCKKARAAGFDVFCDMDLSRELGHIGMHTVRMQMEQEPQAETVSQPAT